MPPRGQDNKDRKGGGKGRRNDSPREAKEFDEATIQIDRVTRVVAGGRRMRFRAAVVIGDRAGRVGFGLGKGNDVQVSIKKAVNEARKHLITIPIVNGTVTHDSNIKFKAAKIMIRPALEGTGLISGSSTRKILELAGIKNVLSKSFGTRNRVVVAQATMKLLASLRMTEAAKKYIVELKKQKVEADKKREEARAKMGDSRDGARRDRGPVKPAVSPVAEAAAKLDATKGRLEEESESKAA